MGSGEAGRGCLYLLIGSFPNGNSFWQAEGTATAISCVSAAFLAEIAAGVLVAFVIVSVLAERLRQANLETSMQLALNY